MPSVATVSISANVSGGPEGTWSLAPPAGVRSIPAAVYSEQVVTMSVGANTINLPAAISQAFIIPPNASFPQPNPTYAGTMTLKGVTGDTGTPMSTTAVYLMSFDPATSPSTIVITATAVGTIKITTA